MSLSNVFPISFSELNQNVFIIGDVNCCKTSLMFQAATSFIKDESETIVFICQSKLTKVPLHVHRMPQLNEKSAKVISIFYLSTLKELSDYICKLFTSTEKLRAILIDNINHYFNLNEINNETNYKDNLTRLFAMVVDTAGHFFNKTCQPCQVLVTCNVNSQCQNFSIFKAIASYFFDDIWTIQKSNQLGASKSFTLINEANYISSFYVEDGQIFLDHISKKY